MSIRTKAIVNLIVFLLLAIALAAQELRIAHPHLLGL